MIMSMGLEYDCELRLPTEILFIPQLIYGHGNHGGMISTGGILIRPPELSGNPTSSNLVAKQEDLAK
jgi:hypothetical protein